jgi:hypothetical protein
VIPFAVETLPPIGIYSTERKNLNDTRCYHSKYAIELGRRNEKQQIV